MKIAFVRTGEAHDRIHVELDDGAEVAWRWPAGGPPHDLLHYAIETELGLDHGFWGLVADGAGLGFVDSHAQGETASLEGRDLTELLQAEAAVAGVTMAITIDGVGPADGLEHARAGCDRYGVAPPAGLDHQRFDALCESAASWIERWRALDARQALTFNYPAEAAG